MKARVAVVLPLAISVIALGAVVWWATRQEAPELPRTGEAGLALAVAVALYALVTAARGERWHRIVQRAGVEASRADSYRLTAVGYMGNNVLPARSGDVLRAILLAPIAHVRKREVLGTVVAERILDALALGLLFSVVAIGVAGDVDVPRGAVLLLLAIAGAVLLAGLAAWLLAPARVRSLARPLATPTRGLASAHGLALLGLSLLLWVLEASVYLAVGRAVDLDLTLTDSLYVVALTNLFALLPAAPGYVGTFDAAVLFAADSLGATGSDALSYLVLLRFILFVPITLVGLAFLLTRYGGWSRYRAARLETG